LYYNVVSPALKLRHTNLTYHTMI